MKLEFLALKWAVTEKFSDYLYGNKFTVVTDNNPLTYALTSAKLDATGHRWISALAAYDFDIIYKPGRHNIDADSLSRYPGHVNNEREQISLDSIKVICKNAQPTPVVETIAMADADIDIMDLTETTGQPMAQIDMREIRRQQREDPIVGFWTNAVRDRKLPMRQQFDNSRNNMAMYRTFDSLKLIRGILYRETQDNGETKRQLVLPAVFIQQALTGVHDDMGHPGRDKTTAVIRERFFWPGMTSDIENWVKNCGRCIRRKKSTNIRAPLVNITSTYPLELVCLDYLTLEPSKGGISNILVMTDHFTRFALAVPTKNQTAKTTAEAFFNEFVVHYGFPAKIHTDQGANFESDLIKEVCELAGIKKSRTTVYHAQGNGMTERMNRTLIGMLGTLEPEKKKNWKKYIGPLVHAYNSMKHESTGVTPYFLMFGRSPRLPIDLQFGIEAAADEQKGPLSEYVKDLQERLRTSYDLVQKAADKAREKQKEYFDRTAKAAIVRAGDHVLVKILAHDGKHKLANKFEEDIYEVISQPNTDIPVFIVRSPNGRQRTLHRNHLLPVGTGQADRPKPAPRNQIEREGQNASRPVPKPRVFEVDRSNFEEGEESTVTVPEVSNAESEDSEDEYITYYVPTGTNGDAQGSNTETEVEIEDRVEDQADRVEDQAVEPAPQLAAPPKPPPRRSQRERRKPDWHGIYQMNRAIVQDQMRENAETVKKLLHTGILNGLTRNAADKIIDAIVTHR